MQKIEMADGPDQFGCALKGQRLGSSPFSSPPPSSPALSLVAWPPLASVADKDLDEDEEEDDDDDDKDEYEDRVDADESLSTPVSVFSSSLES